MITYSHSRISAFEQCPLKFKFKYIEKIEPDFHQSIEGFLGNKVHETLEWIYINSMQGILKQLDEVLEYYIALWQKDVSEEIKIIKLNMTYEDYFNKGIKFLVDYFTTHFPFKDYTIATEKQIFIPLDTQGEYQLQGYIDRLVFNPQTKILEIHDYKTGALKSQEELDKDRQLAIYSCGIQSEIQEEIKEIYLVWHYLAFNKKIVSHRTPDELNALKEETLKKIKQIESTKEFKSKKSMLCNWCEFKSNCPTFNPNQS